MYSIRRLGANLGNWELYLCGLLSLLEILIFPCLLHSVLEFVRLRLECNAIEWNVVLLLRNILNSERYVEEYICN